MSSSGKKRGSVTKPSGDIRSFFVRKAPLSTSSTSDGNGSKNSPSPVKKVKTPMKKEVKTPIKKEVITPIEKKDQKKIM